MTNSKMTQWSLVSNLLPELLDEVFDGFPRSLRCLLGDWIENQPWGFISSSDAFCAVLADRLLSDMVEKLHALANQNSQPTLILQLTANVENTYRREPLKLVGIIKRILEAEQAILLEKYQCLPLCIHRQREEVQFGFHLQKLQYRVQEIQALRESLKQMSDSTRAALMRNTLEQPFPTHENLQANSLQQLHALFLATAKELEEAKNLVLMRFQIWKTQQQLAGNGAPSDEDLDPLQKRYEGLVDICFQLRLQLIASGTELSPELQSRLQECLDNVFSVLIQNSFLVDKQPPQVLKTQTKFQATVRFLLGPVLLKSPHSTFTVTADIVTEKQARELAAGRPESILSESTGEIVSNIAPLETNASNNSCCAVFKNMLLKKIKRCDRKNTESVTEEKCAVLFHTNVTLGPNKTAFHLHALSLPIVVIVHGNQDNNAKATILWDNAFAECGRIPFMVTERVLWKMMCETLNKKFMAEVQTTNGLSNQHYFFLAQKIFGDSGSSLEDFESRHVTWAQFNKEVLPGRGFTFWQWFEGVLDLTKRFLKDYWSDGLIMGFISKQYVYNCLINKPVGTFLLRFSDSEIGGISIAYVSFQDGSSQVENIQPFTAKQLNICSLAKCVLDLDQLEILYPHRQKREAFRSHNNSAEAPRKDNSAYIKTKMRVTVETPCPSASPAHIPGGSMVNPNMNPGGHSDPPFVDPQMILPPIDMYPSSRGFGSPPSEFMQVPYPLENALFDSVELPYPMHPDLNVSDMDICLPRDDTYPRELQHSSLPEMIRMPENIPPPSEQELAQLLCREQDVCHSYNLGSSMTNICS